MFVQEYLHSIGPEMMPSVWFYSLLPSKADLNAFHWILETRSDTNLTFAYKTETLGSLYSHALLIPTKSSKSKHQVVHEQKFIDLLSSTCQVSVERILLDLESEAAWVLFSPGLHFATEFFSGSKTSDANIAIIANFVNLRKTRIGVHDN